MRVVIPLRIICVPIEQRRVIHIFNNNIYFVFRFTKFAISISFSILSMEYAGDQWSEHIIDVQHKQLIFCICNNTKIRKLLHRINLLYDIPFINIIGALNG